MNDSPFRNSVVIITGASSGIGRAIAKQLAAQGASLALAARRVDLLESVAAECQSLGGEAIAVPTDISQPEQCRALVERAVARFGRLDMLVNDAGITMWSSFEDVQDLEIFDRVMRTNYLGYVYCTYYALPYLKRTAGRIVVISSQAGKTGIPTRSGYSASKHAVTGFFDSLRIELRGTGVTVTTIFPGYVRGDQGLGTGGALKDARPAGGIPVMTPDEAARIILRAAAKRKREDMMNFLGRLGIWIKMIAPGLVDRIAARAAKVG